jgi:hypothetical protein
VARCRARTVPLGLALSLSRYSSLRVARPLYSMGVRSIRGRRTTPIEYNGRATQPPTARPAPPGSLSFGH